MTAAWLREMSRLACTAEISLKSNGKGGRDGGPVIRGSPLGIKKWTPHRN